MIEMLKTLVKIDWNGSKMYEVVDLKKNKDSTQMCVIQNSLEAKWKKQTPVLRLRQCVVTEWKEGHSNGFKSKIKLMGLN